MSVAILSWPGLCQPLTILVAWYQSLRCYIADGWQLLYLATPETRTPALNIQTAPGRSCSYRRGTNNKAIKLKLLCFIHVYLQAICEMIKYFASLICGDATCKNK